MEIFPGISPRPQTNFEVCLDWSGDIEECKQKKMIIIINSYKKTIDSINFLFFFPMCGVDRTNKRSYFSIYYI